MASDLEVVNVLGPVGSNVGGRRHAGHYTTGDRTRA
jgi:hypothetical protein